MELMQEHSAQVEETVAENTELASEITVATEPEEEELDEENEEETEHGDAAENEEEA